MSYTNKFSIKIIGGLVLLCLLALGCNIIAKSPASSQEATRKIIAKSIDLKLLVDEKGQPFKLSQNSMIHLHADFCGSCNHDKELFLDNDLKSKIPLIGLKWVHRSKHSKTLPDKDVYSKVITATDTDFFVKLGMTTVPLTLIVDPNGQILYSHLGKLKQAEIDNEILGIIHAQ